MSQAPAAPAEPGTQLPEGVSVEDLTLPDELAASLSPELRKGLSTATDQPAEETDEQPPTDAPAPEVPTTDTSAESTDEALTGYIEQLVENPLSISTVPRAMQGPVLQKLLSDTLEVATQAVENVKAQTAEVEYKRGYDQAKTDFMLQIADDLLESDPETFEPFVKENFGSRANYLRAKEGLPLTPTGEVAAFQDRAAKLVARLNGDPELSAELNAMWQRNPYKASADEMDRLAFDIGTLIAKKGSTAPDDPAAMQQITARQQAADRRKNLPRPPVSAGTNAGSRIITRESLADASPEQVAKWLDDPETAKQIERVASGQ